jgi:trehalose-phosphatase
MSSIPGSLVEDNKYSISTHYRNVSGGAPLVASIERSVDRAIQNAHSKFGTPSASTSPSNSSSSVAVSPLDTAPLRLLKTHGKKVFEVRPALDWDKGKAVLWLLQQIYPSASAPASATAAPDSNDEVVAVYIGDDTTDEDAFRVLRHRQSGGLAIRVQHTYRPTPKPAAATAASTTTTASAAAAAAAAPPPAPIPQVLTLAEYTLKSVDQVQEFLARLCSL